jgi:hypothetical protein
LIRIWPRPYLQATQHTTRCARESYMCTGSKHVCLSVMPHRSMHMSSVIS